MRCSYFQCIFCNGVLPQRILVAVLCLLAVLICYGQRVCLSIAITEIVSESVVEKNFSDCPYPNLSDSEKFRMSEDQVMLSEKEQNLILGCFFLGYMIMHVPTGILSDKFGGRHVLGLGILFSTIGTFTTPSALAHAKWWIVCMIRVLIGCGQAALYPCLSTLFSRWVPYKERNLLGAISFAGNSLGILLGTLLSGLIVRFTFSWSAPFYFWGSMAMIWYVFFMLHIYSDPGLHPHITKDEFDYIRNNTELPSDEMKTPWCALFKDMTIWALVIGEIGHEFTMFTLTTNMPKYMHDVLHYDIRDNSMVSSMPYLCQWLTGVIAGKIVDYVHNQRGVPLLLLRKIVTTIGIVGPCLCIVIAGYMECNKTLVVMMFCLNFFFKGPFYCGLKINHLDLSIHFPGILMALTNGIGAISGFISPYMIAELAADNTLRQWQTIYWIIFLVGTLSSIFYIIFGGAERRKWDIAQHEMEEWTKRMEEKKAQEALRKEAKKEAKLRKKAENKRTS